MAEKIMIELLVLLIVLVIVICVKIYRITKSLAAKEQALIEGHRMCHDTKGCRIYDVLKITLTVIAFLAAAYIVICLATGEVIGTHHLTIAKFWKIAGGSAAILLPKILLAQLFQK